MYQLDLFENSENYNDIEYKTELLSLRNGECVYVPSFFSLPESNYYFQKLKNDIIWKQESMYMYGKQVMFPRLTAWHGDNEISYSFSGITFNPYTWSKELIEIKNRIEPIADTQFNSVLLNRYRDGNDSISWHTDAEKELGINPIIGSVNFGATRKFQLRHIHTKEKVELELSHGSLLIMRGELQHFWQHQVPKTSQKIAERINLTFRKIK